MNQELQTAPQRAFFLDWLRIAAFGLLVIYHVGMYYVSWDWHVKSPFAGPGLEPWMMLTSPWRMALLFLVSGAATSFLLQRDTGGAFLRSRSRRLLLPLLCGVLVIVPPQAYFEVVHKHAFAGSYLDFLRLYFAGYGGFCRAGQCLVLPTWNTCGLSPTCGCTRCSCGRCCNGDRHCWMTGPRAVNRRWPVRGCCGCRSACWRCFASRCTHASRRRMR